MIKIQQIIKFRIHGSDAVDSAKKEIALWFKKDELVVAMLARGEIWIFSKMSNRQKYNIFLDQQRWMANQHCIEWTPTKNQHTEPPIIFMCSLLNDLKEILESNITRW